MWTAKLDFSNTRGIVRDLVRGIPPFPTLLKKQLLFIAYSNLHSELKH